LKLINNNKLTYTRPEQLRGNINNNGAHKYNNDNNTTPIFIGYKNNTKNTDDGRRRLAHEKIKMLYSSKYILISEIRNGITLKYFNLRTNAVKQFQKEDGQVWPKHVAV
jgi:hypothetical protein